MNRLDCISNRNTGVIFRYVESLLGDACDLFEDIPFPEDRYKSIGDCLIDEDEWYEILVSRRAFSMAKNIVDFENVGKIKLKGIHYPVETYKALYEK